MYWKIWRKLGGTVWGAALLPHHSVRRCASRKRRHGVALMNVPIYDIFKKDYVLGPRWVEAVADFEDAKTRALQLAVLTHGEYIVFSQETEQIVARIDRDANIEHSY
jgi:hypothetical protein